MMGPTPRLRLIGSVAFLADALLVFRDDYRCAHDHIAGHVSWTATRRRRPRRSRRNTVPANAGLSGLMAVCMAPWGSRRAPHPAAPYASEVRWAPLLFITLSACTSDWGEANPIFANDEWAEVGCEQHGGTCGGGLFGSCPWEGNWRVDNSLVCSGFEISCCFPTDAGPYVGAAVDGEVPPSDATEAGLDAAALDGSQGAADGGEADADSNGSG